MTRLLFSILLALGIATSAAADPARYQLETDKSSVNFIYDFDGKPTKGTMPVASSEMLIDLDNLRTSKVRVTLVARKARAGFIIATEALRGKSVLDTTSHPHITFVSTKISRATSGAIIDGQVTIRGVTKPMRLTAQFFRQQGTNEGDRSRLSILLTGSISRKAFGATGFPNMVGDQIDLRILARIRRQE